jgi:hypothetical protein
MPRRTTGTGVDQTCLFTDGHVESLGIETTMDATKGVNLWNPSLAK